MNNATILSLLVEFTKQFSTLNQIKLSDAMITRHLYDVVLYKPYCHNRIFQLAMEVAYHKKSFIKNDLYKIFSEDLNILDPIDKSRSVDTLKESDLFNIITASLFKKDLPAVSIETQITPIEGRIPHNLDNETARTLAENKLLTMNVFPDYRINGMPYDSKSFTNMFNVRNHLYTFPLSEQAFKRINSHLYSLKQFLESQQATGKLTDELRVFLIRKAEATLQALSHAKTLKLKREIIYLWNETVIGSIPQRPQLGVPLLQINEEEIPNDVSEDLPKITIPAGNLDTKKIKDVLNAIIGSNPPSVQTLAYETTLGALGRHLSVIDKPTL